MYRDLAENLEVEKVLRFSMEVGLVVCSTGVVPFHQGVYRDLAESFRIEKHVKVFDGGWLVGLFVCFAVARAGVDTILVKWSLNASAPPAIDVNYNKVHTKLCFAPVSQLNRKWRKKSNDLSIDKTCSFDIATQNFSTAGNSVLYLVSKTIPYAEYFVRAYVLNVEGNQVAYGQSTNANKTTNIFTVDPITGRHATIDIAVAVMSVFSVASLFTYYVGEQIYLKRKKSV